MEKYNLKFIFVLCLIFSVFQSCFKSQSNHQYQTVPTSLVSKYWKVSSQKVKGYYDLTKALPKNYSVKGNVDYTQYLQKAIDGYDKVMMPNFPVLINKNGLKLKSNQTVYFPKNAWLIFQGPGMKKLDDVLKIYNVENVVLINPQIEGSKFARIPQEGQWSAGICILNSKNIKITNLRIKNTFGDGLFIGSEDGGFSENIQVKGGWIDSARRNGLSITSGKNVWVEQLFISNTFGHDPEAGVDVEPSWYKDVIENVNLKNIYTYNNKQAGIAVNMNALNVNTDSAAKSIGLTIDGHIDQGSNHAFLTSLNQGDQKNKFDAKGTIKVENTQWLNNREASFWTTPEKHRINILFNKVNINDVQKNQKFKETVQSKAGLKLQ